MFPNDKVKSLIGSKVQIEMKGEKFTLEGTLEIVDEYLNLHLINTTEIVDGERSRVLGSVLVRGNNIILVNPVNE
ncbi:MAG: LSM domain-containing protein [Methanocellales archaeon]|nr:LSM domain-containing protein [Methanocellales archaeon]MDD3291719.1 LSM domain-containing protein [Methanocellales archaeon]MDD5235069.1 LSM domain-containing protein [Methanocellales archaeon]MDD5485207.1 LSM domain-containing protein [Methanocellales archaeon]